MENQIKCNLLRYSTSAHLELVPSDKGTKVVMHTTYASGKTMTCTVAWCPCPITIDKEDN